MFRILLQLDPIFLYNQNFFDLFDKCLSSSSSSLTSHWIRFVHADHVPRAILQIAATAAAVVVLSPFRKLETTEMHTIYIYDLFYFAGKKKKFRKGKNTRALTHDFSVNPS